MYCQGAHRKGLSVQEVFQPRAASSEASVHWRLSSHKLLCNNPHLMGLLHEGFCLHLHGLHPHKRCAGWLLTMMWLLCRVAGVEEVAGVEVWNRLCYCLLSCQLSCCLCQCSVCCQPRLFLPCFSKLQQHVSDVEHCCACKQHLATSGMGVMYGLSAVLTRSKGLPASVSARLLSAST